jgi:hypothetical protein
MIKTKGFVVGAALSFLTTKLLQRGCKGMGYEKFEAGQWVLGEILKTGTQKRAWYKAYVIDDSDEYLERVKVSFLDIDCNNSTSSHGYKYRMMPKTFVKEIQTIDYSEEVDKLFKSVEIDYILDQKNKEEFEKHMKGDAVE